MKKIISVVAAIGMGLGLASCAADSDVASENISKDADNFKILRRIVFYNGITDKYILSIEGYCSISDDGNQLETTCKLGDGRFKKHFLGKSDNVTYFAEQLESADVSTQHYKVIFKPSTVIPEFEAR